MQTSKTLSRGDWTNLVFILALILGFLVRVFPILLVRFPLNDGGLFYVMSRDLRANGFLIPSYTTYNNSGIPFAYPPLGFYIAGFLGAIGIPDIQVFQWLPLLVSMLAIPAYYLLAKTLLNGDEPLAAVATLVFALIPGNYAEQIMGGGLTRSLGVLFYILSIYSVYRLFHDGGWKFVLLSILFCSFAVLSHPEIVLATASGCVLLCLFYAHSWRKILSGLLVALGVIAATAFWWGRVILMYGFTPWLSVLHSGAYGSSPLVLIYLDILSPGSLFTIIGVLRIIGILLCLRKQYFFLISWMLLPYFVEPRSAGGIAYFASCIFIAVGLIHGLSTIVGWIKKRLSKVDLPSQDFTQKKWLSLALFCLMLYWFVMGTFYDFSIANGSLKPPYSQDTFTWIRNNTPTDSQFLVLTGNPEGIMSEPVVEWFPALANRRSLTTLQGLEWTLGSQFFPRLNELKALHECDNVICVENWAIETKSDYTHLLIAKTPLTTKLLASLYQDQGYTLIYENLKYAVFQK